MNTNVFFFLSKNYIVISFVRLELVTKTRIYPVFLFLFGLVRFVLLWNNKVEAVYVRLCEGKGDIVM